MAKARAMINRADRQAEMMDLMGRQHLQDFYTSICEVGEEWIEYKYKQHKQQYATGKSEMYAVKKLMEDSGASILIATRIVEYAQSLLWQGLFLPRDYRLVQRWREEAFAASDAANQYPHLRELTGFPAKAWETPSWFVNESAEAKDDYDLYVAETKKFFGPAAPVLTKLQWEGFCRQEGLYFAGLTPTSEAIYEVASTRLQWHMDYSSDRQHLPLDEYFVQRCLQARLQYA